MVVLNSIVGIDTKNMVSHIFVSPQDSSQYTPYPKKPTEIHCNWLHYDIFIHHENEEPAYYFIIMCKRSVLPLQIRN